MKTAGHDKIRSITMRAFLARLIWLIVLPLAILAVYLAETHVRTIQNQRDREAMNQARNAANAIDRYLGMQIAGLEFLAASPLLDDPPRIEALYDGLRGFRDSFGSHVLLADTSMQMLFNTRVPFGSPLPRLPVPKGRAAAPAALATGLPQVGDMFLGPVAGVPLVAVVVPVIREGVTRFLLSSVIETVRLQKILDEVVVPEGWRLILRDGTDAMMAQRTISDDPSGKVSDDRPHLLFTARSSVAPWSVVLEVPPGVFGKPVRGAAIALAVAILFVLLASVIGGRIAGGRLARSVTGLVSGPDVPPTRPIIAEVEAVRRILTEAESARDAAERTRRESERNFRRLFDITPVPLAFVDKRGVPVNLNARFRQTFGYDLDDIPTIADWWRLAYPDEEYRAWVITTWEEMIRRARETGMDIEPVEYRVTCGDGAVRQVEISGIVLEDGLLAILTDVTHRRETENALRASIEEKVALLKEVHHRVKNNLQIVASLLNLQATRVKNRQVLAVLHDTRDRVRSMALLHETLYRSGNLALIDFQAYVAELCGQLLHSSGPVTARVKLEIQVERISLTLDQSVPCGLIINELVSNALKHAFPEDTRGTIMVGLARENAQHAMLSVRDDGMGLPPDFDAARGASLGLKLVSGLAGQLGGNLSVERLEPSGAAFLVRFPVVEHHHDQG